MPDLRAGFAVRALAPPLGLPMGGYAARSGVAAGVRDPLQCRCAVFRNERGAVAVLLVLDLLNVTRAWADPLRRRIAASIGTTPDAVLVAATHTHSGPALFGVGAAEAGEIGAYESDLASIVLETAAAADRAGEPVSCGFGSTSVEGVGADRTDAERRLDSRLNVLVARRADGTNAGAVAVYGCHPTILPPANLDYSRDLFGSAVDHAETPLGATVLLFNGAAGDVSTRFTRLGQDGAEVERMGAMLGAAIRRAALDAEPLAGDQVSATICEIDAACRPTPDPERAQLLVAEAVAAVQVARERGATAAEIRLSQSRLEGAVAQMFIASRGGARELLGASASSAIVQRLRVGGCDVVACPGELLARDGRAVSAARGRSALVVGYANDYLGYLVTPSGVETGGYESLMALVTPETAAAIVAAMGSGQWIVDGG